MHVQLETVAPAMAVKKCNVVGSCAEIVSFRSSLRRRGVAFFVAVSSTSLRSTAGDSYYVVGVPFAPGAVVQNFKREVRLVGDCRCGCLYDFDFLVPLNPGGVGVAGGCSTGPPPT